MDKIRKKQKKGQEKVASFRVNRWLIVRPEPAIFSSILMHSEIGVRLSAKSWPRFPGF